ncbi:MULTISPECIES: putative sporulation protein YtxC [Tissierellales]|jgi:putative sporulation protein YtxC|uniref:Sporulation protein YtxC n=1 Tax=Acidilutibacter cellobiosedens TaxID=2507161 RepID=A0A410QBK1_9FIRM|nr:MULTISPECIES: putative sporulation protein YtxC [Tissierellales]MBE6082140.1 hypothetical protein [Tissierellaceae bacterium]QAT61339.1 hypothetical protein EQM13_06910 [Acidilutibacter cellobiosedens]SCL94988.1 putative sporulation protein YtxC [Sporanaerobacter sp. PP17-6a]
MELLTISYDKNMDKVRESIYSYKYKEKINIVEEEKGNRCFFKFLTDEKISARKKMSIYEELSHVILNLILEVCIKDMFFKEIFKNCSDFSRSEKIEIGEIGYKVLTENENFNSEKNMIFNEVLNYVKSNTEIAIDGFLIFKLRWMSNFLQGLIEKSKDSFTQEKEYREFIKILQYFVDIQEPKMEIINVLITKDDYKLFDKDNKVVDNNFFSDIIGELNNENISKDDILISSLIVIAPKKLILHVDEKAKNREIVEIIKNVFSERILFCTGCNLCSINFSLKKGK